MTAIRLMRRGLRRPEHMRQGRGGLGAALAGGCAIAGLAGFAAMPTGVEAAGGGTVRISWSVAGLNTVDPGDVLAAGYAVQVAGSGASVSVSGAWVTIPLTCQGGGGSSVTLSFATASYNAGPGWTPTSQSQPASSYQTSATVGGHGCGGGGSYRAGTATFSATLTAADTSNPFSIRFHVVDGAQGGDGDSGRVNCADPSQNPGGGISACDGPWSPAASTTAAPANPPTPPPTARPTPTPTPTAAPPAHTPAPTPSPAGQPPTSGSGAPPAGPGGVPSAGSAALGHRPGATSSTASGASSAQGANPAGTSKPVALVIPGPATDLAPTAPAAAAPLVTRIADAPAATAALVAAATRQGWLRWVSIAAAAGALIVVARRIRRVGFRAP
jgi:hypothetical protein